MMSVPIILKIVCVTLLLCHVGGVSARRATSRIVGGQKITIDKVPYIVQLRDKDGDAYCGGTLITSKYVVTAAHCIDGMDVKSLVVVGGVSTITEKGVQSKIAKATMHPDYKDEEIHSDIAIIELASELKGKNIKTLELCKQPLKKGDYVQVSGWGRLVHNVPGMAHDLHTVRLPVASQEDCEDEYGDDVNKNVFCASGLEPKGACKGDSGGPAVFNNQLCGVNGFTSECGADHDMTGFMDIYRLRSFIEKTMGAKATKK